MVEATPDLIQLSRTNIYRYTADRRYFWCRASNRQLAPRWNESQRAASGLAVQDLGEFYEALAADRIVSIGESHSSLKSDLAEKLMQQIRVRSLLAGPILLDGELFGFLAVEDNHPRIWHENEKNYLRGVAQLVGLTSPLSEMEEKIQEARSDRDLTASITKAIFNNSNWQETLKTIAESLSQRLGTKFFLLLERSPKGQFKPIYHNFLPQTTLKPNFLNPLSQDELKLLEGEPEVVAIDNLQQDKRLKTWRKDLWNLGMRGILASKTGMTATTSKEENATGGTGEGVLVLGSEAGRTWNKSDRELVGVVSQQLGLILYQYQHERVLKRQKDIGEALQLGLTILQPNVGNLPQTNNDISDLTLPQAVKISAIAPEKSLLGNLALDRLQRNFVEFIAKIIGEFGDSDGKAFPLVVLVTWTPGATVGKIAVWQQRNPSLLSIITSRSRSLKTN